MKLISRSAIGLFAAITLVACGQTTSTPTPPEVSPIDNCASWESRNWLARDNRMPGPDGPKLSVGGEVDFPGPGYTWTLLRNRADDPASSVVNLILAPVAPAGGSAGDTSIHPTQVDWSGPATAPAYTEIIITCGRGTLRTITEIEVVH